MNPTRRSFLATAAALAGAATVAPIVKGAGNHRPALIKPAAIAPAGFTVILYDTDDVEVSRQTVETLEHGITFPPFDRKVVVGRVSVIAVGLSTDVHLGLDYPCSCTRATR